MTVFHFLHNLHIISLSICVSNTTALAEIGCLHQRLWRYNLVIIFLFRFINFCFLVCVIDSHFSWRVWQRPTTITRGYIYKLGSHISRSMREIFLMWLRFFKVCIVSLIFQGINLLSLSITVFWSQLKLWSPSQQCLAISFLSQSQFLTDLLCSSTQF